MLVLLLGLGGRVGCVSRCCFWFVCGMILLLGIGGICVGSFVRLLLCF